MTTKTTFPHAFEVFETIKDCGHTGADYGCLLGDIEDHIAALGVYAETAQDLSKLDRLLRCRDALPGANEPDQYRAASESWEHFRHSSGIRSYEHILTDFREREHLDLSRTAPYLAEAAKYFPDSDLGKLWHSITGHYRTISHTKTREHTLEPGI